MSLPKTVSMKAANGQTLQMPSIGLGCGIYAPDSDVKSWVLHALKSGYRHLDCAWLYGTGEAVGQAIKESGVPRKDIFVTSKLWCHFGHPDNVELGLDQILANMGLDYLDLFLTHWPFVTKPLSKEALLNAKGTMDKGIFNPEIGQWFDDDNKPVMDWEHTSGRIAKNEGHKGSFVPTWKSMQECVRKGKAKAIGLSNASIADIEELLPHSKEIPVSCTQVEIHPWLPQREMVAFGEEHGIVIAAYSPFGGPAEKTLVKDEKVVELAEKNGVDAGQLLQSWAVQRGTVPLGKSATASRIESNMKIHRLSEETMKALGQMEAPNGKGRATDPAPFIGFKLFD